MNEFRSLCFVYSETGERKNKPSCVCFFVVLFYSCCQVKEENPLKVAYVLCRSRFEINAKGGG
jgi:hypothetical protein